MQVLILMVHLLLCVSIVALVLVQHGKGADVGAAFGSGASNTMFGSAGSTSFLFKLTMSLAALFFATSVYLTYVVDHSPHPILKSDYSQLTQGAMPHKLTLNIHQHPRKKA